MLPSSNKKYSYEVCQVRPMCNDKTCQSAKSMCYDKKGPAKSEATHSASVSKTASKQIGAQHEITRKIKHSRSKSYSPSESTQVSPVLRNYNI